jgi:tripartite-type tricarboxylate transporter receptor subunit TctC
MSDFLPGYESSGWTGIGAPRNTPAQIIGALNAAIRSMLADQSIIQRFADFGLSILAGSPTDFAALIHDETDKWGKVIRAVGIKAE